MSDIVPDIIDSWSGGCGVTYHKVSNLLTYTAWKASKQVAKNDGFARLNMAYQQVGIGVATAGLDLPLLLRLSVRKTPWSELQ